jgi:hypothetical protein
MSDAAAEFQPTRVGSGARVGVVVVPLLLVGVVGLGILGGRSVVGPKVDAPVAAAPKTVYIPWQAPRRTWSVSNPNDAAPRLHRLMRLARLVDPYQR